ncbi:hypothetical protein [Microvirga massiliensis]|uniref:hypothetical protein n=1 Tax=Microvirga massiliensis TaxID=1033741 RepID=UPI00062BD31B|nr:hypothetical protein [Microvirga massiliensis]
MSDEEVEAVAAELAKVGGPSWYPGRTKGPILRVVSERFRDRARVAIAALDRFRASKDQAAASGEMDRSAMEPLEDDPEGCPPELGSIVVYRPPGEQRAISCRVTQAEGGRVYLVPLPQPDIGWVSVDTLQLERIRLVQ